MEHRDPQVRTAETLGFCRGVRAAVDLVDTILKDPSWPRPIQTLGPLIHNRTVLEEMHSRGLRVLERPEDAVSGTVIIRAHGVPPEVRQQLELRKLTVVDATCRRVTASQRLAARYSEKNYHLILAGNPNHGEIQAIRGYAQSATCVDTADHLRQIIHRGELDERAEGADGLALIGQTTLRPGEYRKISEILKSRYPDIRICRTICPATEKRQDALRTLCRQVNAVLVVGGHNSANTQGLHRTALDAGLPAWHIEGVEEIPEGIYDYPLIGVTAGASTPDQVIEQVLNRLETRR